MPITLKSALRAFIVILNNWDRSERRRANGLLHP